MIKFDPKLLEEVENAKEKLFNHGVIAFPTETVMGLGVLYNDKQAYDRLNQIKRRPEDKPYTMMVAELEDIAKYAVVDEPTQRVINAFMPGSITLLLNVKDNSVPAYVTHNTGIIGIRIPSNLEARMLLQITREPLLVPSANRSGEAPAMNSDEVKNIFGNEVDFVISGKANSGLPSTIVDLTKGQVIVVREGPISKEQIERVYYNK